jgi:ribosomal protein S18 acetylase RimI-like enzyme
MLMIRHMRESDLLAVSQVLCECYRWLGRREGCTPGQIEFLVSKRGSLECVRRESQHQEYMVACIEGAVVGVVALSANKIAKLYVAPSHHGQGIGRLLYEAAEAQIRKTGHDRVVLGAFPTAVPFYEGMGFAVTGRKTCSAGALSGFPIALMEKQLARGSTDQNRSKL